MLRLLTVPRTKTKNLARPGRNIKAPIRDDHRMNHSVDTLQPVIKFQRPAGRPNYPADARRSLTLTHLVLVQLTVDDIIKRQLSATKGA